MPGDQPLLAVMLAEAAFWRGTEQRPSPADLVDDPELGRYVGNWGRDGDFGFVAEKGGEPIGAVWLRHFERDNLALALYERFGFARVRTVGNAWTMMVDPGRATR